MAWEKACCFSGHRSLPREEFAVIEAGLEREMKGLIRRGVVDFLAGGALGFDTIAAKMVLRLKETEADIRLILVLPCEDQDRNWAKRDREEYRRLIAAADEVIVLADQYFDGCMQQRNRYMVDHSRYVISYQRSKAGGTAYTVRYAKKNQREIINLAPRENRLF